ncbi:MAG: ATP-binding protein [Candidatus Auribacterota bacterium]|jgi:two-component system chemotaxis sensor kinase CheA|nr:ATP-binding protein [Candidatus Auribacterota bacterium]
MKKKHTIPITDEVRQKIQQAKTSQNELLEVDVAISGGVEFPSLKAMEFIVGIGEFIESVPSIFSETIDEENRFYRFFYTITPGNRKYFEDLIYNRFFNDDEIENVAISFMPEEFRIQDVFRPPKLKHQQHQIMHIEFSKLDKTNKLITDLNICTSRFQHLQQNLQNIADINELQEFQKDFGVAVQSLVKLTNSLHKNSINMQMLPLHTLTGKYRRIIYDYCRSTGKQIKLTLNNGSIQFDKRIIDKLDEPLVHIIRNAMDHGIESPEERKKKGKPVEGNITITGSNRGERAVIEISDDGAGLDAEKIRATCLHKGLFPEEKIGNMNEDELFQCLFMPGFSTSRIVTDISGRGVGLDVVYTAVKQMHGKINLFSKKGEGTTIRLTLPETLSLIKTVFVSSGGEIFAIPTKSIFKMLTSREIQCHNASTGITLQYQDNDIPVYNLKALFSHQAYIEDSQDDCFKNDERIYILSKIDSGLIALEGNRILDMHDVVVKPFGSYLGSIPGYGGAVICWDGSIVYLIDISTIESRISDYERG